MTAAPARALGDLRARAADDPKIVATELKALVRAGLKSEHVLAAARIVAQLVGTAHGFETRKVAVLGEPTVDAIASAAAVALVGEGVVTELYVAPFGVLQQEILDPASGLYRFAPDLVLLVPLPAVAERPGDAAPATAADEWAEIWRVVAERVSNVRIVQHLHEVPALEPVGVAERRVAWSAASATTAINEALLERAPQFVHLLDLDALAARVGRLAWFDPRLWYSGKLPFAPKFLADYTAALAAAFRRALGRSKKALVVDLDNTLWGGVIGDDGLEGIKLGPGDPLGEAYADFCAYVQGLGRRGVILGVCSKNDRDTAAAVFAQHPHMPLKLDDFAAFVCNWNDKASNLRAIAERLNIDVSAIVYADDNPFECGLVQREIPAIQTVELSGDPASFRGRIDALRAFEIERLLAADLGRAASYRAREAAESLRTSAASLDDYLSGLEMRGRAWLARGEDIARLAQMESKTNQFNLSTRRLSEHAIETMAGSASHVVLAVSLADKFTDHGLVAYMAAEQSGSQLTITDWLMSCRVFARGLEQYTFLQLLDLAVGRGIDVVRAAYSPTPKNRVIEGLLASLGFVCVGAAPEGPWEFRVADSPRPRTLVGSG
jgi:FkbH-like protein